MLKTAIEFATKHHEGQMYGDKPYTYHLEQVADIVESYGEEAQVMAWLHDVVEDTDVNLKMINYIFGRKIACGVFYLTDPEGKSRKKRKKKLYKMLETVHAGDFASIALTVKTADRLANVREGKKNDMYRDEYIDFKKAVYRRGTCEVLWEEILYILFF